jgi:hypothetical protein
MWFYNNEVFTDSGDYYGFVYLIENLANGRKYIGKKLFIFTKTKVVKGKRKKIKSPSDWQTYWSSSDELKLDVAKLGEQNFRRTILHLCKNKGTCNYLEAREQFERRVLETNEYYNGWISCKIGKNQVKL